MAVITLLNQIAKKLAFDKFDENYLINSVNEQYSIINLIIIVEYFFFCVNLLAYQYAELY
jgi:hypothetical protein